MRLRKFRVRAFRCIHDSGEIKVGDLASFIGRNESGKTTILQALTLLNKDEELSELDMCDEMSEELKSEIKIAEGDFELSPNETQMIKENQIKGEDREKLIKLLHKPWNPYLLGRHSSITEKTDLLNDFQLKHRRSRCRSSRPRCHGSG